jgi:hypothetical protein
MPSIMSKLILAFVWLLILAAPSAFGQATEYTAFGCIIIPADWGTGSGPLLFTTNSKSVQSDSGNVNFLCDFTIPAPANVGGPAVIKKGFLCGTQFGFTNDTRSVTDWENGTVHLSCKIKP